MAATFLLAASAQAGVPAHSHWDDPNGNYELDFCLVVQKAPQSGTIAYIPLREQDAQDYMALHITTNGLTLETRIKQPSGSGQSFYDPSPLAAAHTYHNPSAPAHYGVGDEVMVAFVMNGNVYTAYVLNDDGTHGAMLDQWTDTSVSGGARYLQGVNISYYVNPGYKALWEDVNGFPLPNSNGVGVGHTIEDLEQDASTDTACGEPTHDDETPADGSVTDTSASALSGTATNLNWGLASGENYEYTFDVSGVSGTSGYFDYRDPQAPDNTYYKMGFYRFRPGNGSTPPRIERYAQTWTGNCVKVSSPTTPEPNPWVATGVQGGNGHYTLDLIGDTQYLYKDGLLIKTVQDGTTQSGIRVRLHPSATEHWSWTGRVLPDSSPQFVRQTEQDFASGHSSDTVTIPATAAGDSLVVLVSQAAASTAVPFTVSGGGASWTSPPNPLVKQSGPAPVDWQTGANTFTSAAYSVAVPAGTTSVTLTWAAASKANSVLVTEWSGVSAVDASAAGGGASALTTQLATPLTTTAQDAVVEAVEAPTTLALDGAGSTPSSGWTALSPGAQGASHALAAYRIGAAGSYAAAWTLGIAAKAGMVALALKP